jgi:hypothetical protein
MREQNQVVSASRAVLMVIVMTGYIAPVWKVAQTMPV